MANSLAGKLPLIIDCAVYHNVSTLKDATATIGNVSVGVSSLSASPLAFKFNGNLSNFKSGTYVATIEVVDSENNNASITSSKIYIDNTPPTIDAKLYGTFFSPQGVSWNISTTSTYSTSVKFYFGNTIPRPQQLHLKELIHHLEKKFSRN